MPLNSPPLGKPQAPTMTKSFDHDYEVWCQILWMIMFEQGSH